MILDIDAEDFEGRAALISLSNCEDRLERKLALTRWPGQWHRASNQ
jgi:hypothetical protein